MFYLFIVILLLSSVNCFNTKVGFLHTGSNYYDLFKKLIENYITELNMTITPEEKKITNHAEYQTALNDFKKEKITVAFGVFEMDDPVWYDEIARSAGVYIFNSYLSYNISICLTNIIINRSPCDSDNSGISLIYI